MKYSLTLVIILLSLGLFPEKSKSQVDIDLTGTWVAKKGEQKTILIFQDGYFTHTIFTNQAFVSSFGGPYRVSGDHVYGDVEFFSQEEEAGGAPFLKIEADATLNGKQLRLMVNQQETLWERLDNSAAPLAGVWQITDRMQEGEIVPIHSSGTRKTLKILTGTRFQWFAIDPATRLFAGTGGGTYSFENGKYTENIDFFSRDNSRVGASLVFDGKLDKGKWHHSGLSSKGDKIYEVWGKVK